MNTLMTSTAILATVLAAVALSAPAGARPTQCQIKHSQCSERCIMNNKGEGAVNACISRTCDHQNPGCGPETVDAGGGSGRGRGKSN